MNARRPALALSGFALALACATPGQAAVSPIVGQAGYTCQDCGDLVSGENGFNPPFLSPLDGYKPVVFTVEVPPAEAGGAAVPFALRFFDLGIASTAAEQENPVGDHCRSGECDSATLVRIFPPSNSACPDVRADFAVVPGDACDSLASAGVLPGTGCDSLNGRELVIPVDVEAPAPIETLGIPPSCIVPGLWRVELHTDAWANGFVESPYDDVDVYRFGATQIASVEGTCLRPLQPIRVFTPALNLAQPRGASRIEGLFWTEQRGGWALVMDSPELATSGVDPVQSILHPTATVADEVSSFPSSDIISQTISLGPAVTRVFIPSCYLAGTVDCTGPPVGYPTNVSVADSQGTWGINYRSFPQSGTVISSVVMRQQRDVQFPASSNPFPWVTTVDYGQSGPGVLYPNANPIYLPFAPAELENACDGLLEAFDLTNPNPSPGAPMASARDTASKPNVVRRARRVPEAFGNEYECYEVEVRLVVPGSGTIAGPVEAPRIFVTKADNGLIGFGGFTTCSPNTAGEGSPTGAGGNAPQNLNCDQLAGDDPSAGGVPFEQDSGANRCEDAFNDVAGGSPAGPFEVVFPVSEASAGAPAFVRYVIAVDTSSGDPVFFSERGAGNEGFDRQGSEPLGSRVVWIDENVDPALTPASPTAPPNFEPQSLSYGGGSDGGGGASTSGDGTDDPSQLASIDSVRALADPRGRRMVELTTSSEVLTGGFRLERRDNDDWRVVGPFVASRPGRVAGVYRFELPGDSPDAFTVRAVELELDGGERDHGPYSLSFETVGALPSLGAEGGASIDRPLGRAAAAPLVLRSTSLPPSDRARLVVPAAGAYRVSYPDLASALTASAAELAARASAGQLRLSRAGRSVAYFAEAEGISFWSASSDEPGEPGYVVSLEPGRRARQSSSATPPQSPTEVMNARLRFEEDRQPATATESLLGDDYMMWAALRASAGADARFTHVFDAPGVALGEAELVLALRGGSQGPRYPDHGLQVRLNGEPLRNLYFFGFDDQHFRVRLPAGTLQETNNVLELESYLAPSLAFAVEWVDWLELRYPRATHAVDNRALFAASGEGWLRVGGFSAPELRAWGIDGQGGLSALALQVEAEGSEYVALIQNGFARDRQVFVFESSGLAEPTVIEPLGGGRVRTFDAGAEYVVVTHPALRDGAEALARYRAEQGLSVAVFGTDELYDAFTHGEPSAEALRGLLHDAETRWRLRPNYLVLVGDGSSDLNNALGHNDGLVPILMQETDAGAFGSDTLLGDVGPRAGLEVAVGRIPARSAEELTLYLEKVRAFEAHDDVGNIESALLVADDPDAAGDFHISLSELEEALDADLIVEALRLSPDIVAETRDAVLASIERGTRFVHYVGHGSILGLSGEGLLTRDDVSALGNAESPMVLLAATCLVGRFDVPGIQTLSEALLLQDTDGAAAVFASAGLETNAQASLLTQILGERIASERYRRIGGALRDASQLARARGVSSESLALHTLLGDPALMLWDRASELPLREQPMPSMDEPPPAAPMTPSGPANTDASERSGGCRTTPAPLLMAFWAVARARKRCASSRKSGMNGS